MKTHVRLSALFLLPLFIALSSTIKTEAQITVILRRMSYHYGALSSLRSKITMEQYNSQLSETDTFKGNLSYARDSGNKISMKVEWTKPLQEQISIINDYYVLYRPGIRQAYAGRIKSSKSNIRSRYPLSFLFMSRNDLRANYDISYLGQEFIDGKVQTWHLKLLPRNPVAFKSADLWVDANGMMRQVKLFERDADIITILLSEFIKNEPISNTFFQINLPKSTKIIASDVDALYLEKLAGFREKAPKVKRKAKPARKAKIQKKRAFRRLNPKK